MQDAEVDGRTQRRMLCGPIGQIPALHGKLANRTLDRCLEKLTRVPVLQSWRKRDCHISDRLGELRSSGLVDLNYCRS